MTRFRIDTHLHIYPFQDPVRALGSLLSGLDDGSPAVLAGCLTERYDCDLFGRLAQGAETRVTERFRVERHSETVLRIAERDSGRQGFLVAGQQIVTSENIEILGLNLSGRVAEGRPAAATVEAVLAGGGLPVAAWGFGKWLFARGRVVRSLVQRFGPAELAIGDTGMRPIGWLEPRIMAEARRRGHLVLAGSDPLPFAGEEIRPGSYFSEVVTDDTISDPGALIEKIAGNRGIEVRRAGHRGSPITVARRLLAHRAASRS